MKNKLKLKLSPPPPPLLCEHVRNGSENKEVGRKIQAKGMLLIYTPLSNRLGFS